MKDKAKTWRWRIYKAGHTISSFAKLSGIRQPQISNWINGIKIPKKSSVLKVEKVLKRIGA